MKAINRKKWWTLKKFCLENVIEGQYFITSEKIITSNSRSYFRWPNLPQCNKIKKQ